ncbi:rubredoxin-like domain-containing protein [Desulfopila sp. IMCC35008]|uniref:rubredoxin-like domain-containing protein n=1 Tax=Desulfopila sp. IMCC35008 TaxID=2653858 RepID=UPI0013D59AC4|nr:DUF2231 domain-containing protein [Desulfopila sp. IMCC35008]
MKKWKCAVCGYIHEGDSLPEECPLCKASSDKFDEVVEDTVSSDSSTRYWKCTVCGYIHEGASPPDECPLCKASSDKFVEVDAEGKEITGAKPVSKPLPPKKDTAKTGAKKSSIIARLNSKFHLHPISVHTPNGVLPLAVLLLAGAIFLRLETFEKAAYYNMLFTLAVMPVVIGTGFLEWRERFNSTKSFLFITKIFCASVVTLSLSILVLWRFVNPGVASAESPYKWIYMGLAVVMVGAAGIAGHLGGKLVFGSR